MTTSRPDRYAKQLAAHLGRKHGGHWSDTERLGWVQFPSGRVDLSAADGMLTVTAAADSQAVTELQDIVARHLLRFAGDDAVQVLWTVVGSDAEVDPLS